jgi:DNA-binding transcriptional ArsR family regulator
VLEGEIAVGHNRKEDELSQQVVQAMAHPLRIRILRILSERVASPKEMARATGEAPGNVAYHARVLLDLNCTELVKTASRRGAREHFYRAKPDAFTSSRKWKALPSLVRGEIAATVFRELHLRVVGALGGKTFQRREDSNLLCLPFEVDEAGWKELVEIVAVTEQAIEKVSVQAAERLEDRAGIPAVVALGIFEAALGHSSE